MKAPAVVVKAAVGGVDVVYAEDENVGPTVSDMRSHHMRELLNYFYHQLWFMV